MTLPRHAKYLIIGAGIHGLSTAYHLALSLKAQGNGAAADILVVDKSDIAAGASGIACGVVRNNYYQPAMRELMAACVEAWEADPEAYHYHPVGYMQISPESMHADVAEIAEQQRAIGYESDVRRGRGRLHDVHAQAVRRLAGARHHLGPAREEGRLRPQQGLHAGARGQGERRRCAHPHRGRGQGLRLRRQLQGGDLGGDRSGLHRRRSGHRRGRALGAAHLGHARPAGPDRRQGPGRHAASRCRHVALLVPAGGDDRRRALLRHGRRRLDAAGDPRRFQRAALLRRGRPADHRRDVGHLLQAGLQLRRRPGRGRALQGEDPVPDVAIDPYGPESPEFVVDDEFREMWCSALALCQSRYSGQIGRWLDEPSGGIGAFTADSFPCSTASARTAT